MVCDLCGRRDPPIQRVDGWTVCVPCASNGVLKEALLTSAKLKGLRVSLAARLDLASHASEKQKLAEQRIIEAKRELDEAIRVLAEAAREAEAAEQSVQDATEQLGEFRSTHDAEPRDGDK